jgi:hypothetical protein
MRLRPLPPAPHQLGSIGRVYYVFANSEQEVFAKNEQRAVEKYARTPDSVLFDKGLSIAARCVYGVLARHAFQGTTANIGQRRIANLLGVHVGTVNRSLHELEERRHIAIRGKGKAGAYITSAPWCSARSSAPESKRSSAAPAGRRGWRA